MDVIDYRFQYFYIDFYFKEFLSYILFGVVGYFFFFLCVMKLNVE